MDQIAEEACEGQRKTVVIISDRAREIIRLFEDRQRKRQSEDGRRAEFQMTKSPGGPPFPPGVNRRRPF
jgi:hypothetical protein